MPLEDRVDADQHYINRHEEREKHSEAREGGNAHREGHWLLRKGYATAWGTSPEGEKVYGSGARANRAKRQREA